MRWRIAILISAAIAISYLDRQTLPVALKAIGRDIPLSNEQFSTLQSAFLFAYSLMYVGGGKLVDMVGTRQGFIVVMVFWSLACASHALAMSFLMLAASRFLLGAGEGGGFPAASRAVAEWFPPEERATAMGIINAGTAVGALAAPPLVAFVLSYTNWRWIFAVTGGLGMAWAAWWALSAPTLTTNLARRTDSSIMEAEPIPKVPWVQLVLIRETRGLVLAKFLSDAAWFFYLFWLPKYLYDARGFDVKAVGLFAWMPSAAAGIGCLVGGAFSSYLVQRRYSIGIARKVALGLSAMVMPFVILVPRVQVSWAIALFCLAYFGQQSWSTLVMVLPTDLFPPSVVGSVAGLVGFGGAMGGIVFGQTVGYLLDHGSGYGIVFAIAGILHVAAYLIIVASVPVIEPLNLDRFMSCEGVP